VLGLREVWVAPTTHSATLGEDLSDAVTSVIKAMELTPGDVLLIASGRTTYEVSRASLPRLLGVQLAPTVGGLSEPSPWFQTNEITLRAAERKGAFPAFLFAQALPSGGMRQSLDDDAAFPHMMGLWRTAKGALLGIGAPTLTRDSLLRFITVHESNFDSAVGDVCMNIFDETGAAIEFDGSDRMVRTSREILQRIPHGAGIAVGLEKVPSVLAAVRARLINELVTDTVTARALLAESARGWAK